MKALTKQGQQNVNDIAAKYNLRTESVESLLKAVISGSGNMAQFNIPELGGAGQWMKGGMTMVGDMFNHTLKNTVDKLCTELSQLVQTQVLFEETSDLSNGKYPTNSGLGGNESSSWPSVFGKPTSSGSQNNLRYAYFAPVRRLVIEENGKRTIYDTKHHHITGISQQQGSGSSYKFTSQEGNVDLGGLPVISEPTEPSQPTPGIAYDVISTADLGNDHILADRGPTDRSPTDRSPEDIIIATIEKVNVLFEKGQISEEEFKAKKQELLSRL